MDADKERRAVAADRAGEVESFLDAVRKTPVRKTADCGRLVFALDATMSRQPSWDLAQELQAQMFTTASACGGLDIQLVYFRGFGECRASRFIRDGAGLASVMGKISVRGGQTQIGKVLRHIKAEQAEAPVGAFVFIGDAMEENADDLARAAGELGLRGVKGFFFQEGRNSDAAACFKDLARLTGGAYAVFDRSAPGRLAGLLKAAAAYAAGGFAALEARAQKGEAEAKFLLSQMK
jgi:hypothetical protein